MKIYFDNIIFNLQRAGGISVYWTEMISRVLHEPRFESIFIEVEFESKNIFRKILKIPKTQVLHKITSFPFITRYLPVRLYSRDAIFIFHSSYLRFCRNKNAINIATIYDCTYELYGSGLSKAIHRLQKKYLLKNADVVVCISQNTKTDLIRLYPSIDEKKLKVTYLSAGDEFHPINVFEEPREYENILKGSKYLIFVGSRAEYKNFDLVMAAMESLKEYMLLVVGGGGDECL